MNSRGFISIIPWILPLGFLLPYAIVASRFRGLIWVWESGYKPFWIALGILILLAALSSFLLWKLKDLGVTLYQVGLGLSTIQLTYLAMSERRHSLLIVLFFLFSLQLFLSEVIKRVLRLPFYDSRRKWWEAYPKGIPRLRVELLSENGDTSEVRISNFGFEGCFVFSESSVIPFSPKALRIRSEEKQLLEADVEAVIRTNDGFGWGLRFNQADIAGDWSKDLEDYLFVLRRAGYEVP